MKETLNRAYIFVLVCVFSFVQVCAQTPSGPKVEKTFRKVEVKLVSHTGEKMKAIAPRGYYVEPKPKEQKSP